MKNVLDWFRRAVPKDDPLARRPGVGMFMGTDRRGREAWLDADAVRQHMLVMGNTGAGKTEFLVSMVSGALSWGSGAVFVDGKGDPSLYSRVMEQAHAFGREDDVLVLNFMNYGRDLSAGPISNTFNPFAAAPADTIVQTIVELMDDAGGDGAMWKGRATAMLTAVVRYLAWRRDSKGARLDVGSIRDCISLLRIVDMMDDGEAPAAVRKSVRSYLTSLPGFQDGKGYRQSQTTLDQHGYLEMQFTKILGSLGDVYGHIFCPEGAPEIDMTDVVTNRRVLVVLLPSLAKSGDEVRNLGKIIVGSLRSMMGAVLGSRIEGSWSTVVEERAQPRESPFLCILDEVDMYLVSGLGIMTAQARSLGFGMVFASHGADALGGPDGASILGNTNTKVYLRHDVPPAALPAETAAKLCGFLPGECLLTHRGEARWLTAPYLSARAGAGEVRLGISTLADTRALGAELAARRGFAARIAGVSLPPLPEGFELEAPLGDGAFCGGELASAALRSVGSCAPGRAEPEGPMLDLSTGMECQQ